MSGQLPPFEELGSVLFRLLYMAFESSRKFRIGFDEIAEEDRYQNAPPQI
jgi:hypothetical protein